MVVDSRYGVKNSNFTGLYILRLKVGLVLNRNMAHEILWSFSCVKMESKRKSPA